MKQVTRAEYLASFMDRDAIVSIPEAGTAEWTMRGSRIVIARSVDRYPEGEDEPYIVTDYFISEF